MRYILYIGNFGVLFVSLFLLLFGQIDEVEQDSLYFFILKGEYKINYLRGDMWFHSNDSWKDLPIYFNRKPVIL